LHEVTASRHVSLKYLAGNTMVRSHEDNAACACFASLLQ